MSSRIDDLFAESLNPRSQDLRTGSKEGACCSGEESGFGSLSGYSGHIVGQTSCPRRSAMPIQEIERVDKLPKEDSEGVVEHYQVLEGLLRSC